MRPRVIVSGIVASALLLLTSITAGAVSGTGPPQPGGPGGCSSCGGTLHGGGSAPWTYNCAGWGSSGGQQLANEFIWPSNVFGYSPTLVQLTPHIWSPSNPGGYVFEVYGAGFPASLHGAPPGDGGNPYAYGSIKPYYLDYGCVEGTYTPPTLSIPSFGAQGVNLFPSAPLVTAAGTADLVETATTATAGPCPAVSPLPTLPATIPSTVQYFYSPGVGAASTCPKSIVIWGTITSGGATAQILIEEQMHLVPYTGCSAADPYHWNFDQGGSSVTPAPTFCGTDSGSYLYAHVVDNPPGVSIEALSSWQPECYGSVTTFAGTTEGFGPVTGPGNTVGPGVVINCDPLANQTYGPTKPKAVDQIEAIGSS